MFKAILTKIIYVFQNPTLPAPTWKMMPVKMPVMSDAAPIMPATGAYSGSTVL